MRVKITARKTALTLIEIMIVVLILGILAVIGVANMASLSKNAHQAVENETVGIVRRGLNLYPVASLSQGKDSPFPASLDNAPDASAAGESNPFFSTVVNPPGVTDAAWHKVNATTYQGPTGQRYSYDNNAGSFFPIS